MHSSDIQSAIRPADTDDSTLADSDDKGKERKNSKSKRYAYSTSDSSEDGSESSNQQKDKRRKTSKSADNRPDLNADAAVTATNNLNSESPSGGSRNDVNSASPSDMDSPTLLSSTSSTSTETDKDKGKEGSSIVASVQPRAHRFEEPYPPTGTWQPLAAKEHQKEVQMWRVRLQDKQIRVHSFCRQAGIEFQVGREVYCTSTATTGSLNSSDHDAEEIDNGGRTLQHTYQGPDYAVLQINPDKYYELLEERKKIAEIKRRHREIKLAEKKSGNGTHENVTAESAGESGAGSAAPSTSENSSLPVPLTASELALLSAPLTNPCTLFETSDPEELMSHCRSIIKEKHYSSDITLIAIKSKGSDKKDLRAFECLKVFGYPGDIEQIWKKTWFFTAHIKAFQKFAGKSDDVCAFQESIYQLH